MAQYKFLNFHIGLQILKLFFKIALTWILIYSLTKINGFHICFVELTN